MDCMHAFGAHLPIEKVQKATHRSRLFADWLRVEQKIPFYYMIFPLFDAPAFARALFYYSACQRVKPSLMVESTLMSFSSMGSTFSGSLSTIIRSAHLPSSREPLVFSSKY